LYFSDFQYVMAPPVAPLALHSALPFVSGSLGYILGKSPEYRAGISHKER